MTQNRPTQRPWGSYLVTHEGDGHKTKCITVHPRARLSYQRHQHRNEHWFVVAGDAEVTVNGQAFRLGPGECVHIPMQTPHRVANPGPERMVLVEVQTGSYLGEDDVDRLDDDYGRAPMREDKDEEHT